MPDHDHDRAATQEENKALQLLTPKAYHRALGLARLPLFSS